MMKKSVKKRLAEIKPFHSKFCGKFHRRGQVATGKGY